MGSEFIIASPFSLYSVLVSGTYQFGIFEQSDVARPPPYSIAICDDFNGTRWAHSAQISQCLGAAPRQEGGIVFWPAIKNYNSSQSKALPVEGSSWSSHTGAIFPCHDVISFAAPGGLEA